jgi:hypothetical protein
MNLDGLLAESMKSGESPKRYSATLSQTQIRLGQFNRLWFFRTEPYHFPQEAAVTEWFRLQYWQVDEQRFGQLVLALLVQSPEQHPSGEKLSSGLKEDGRL